MHARERLYLTADLNRLVRHGDPAASFLYAAEGDEIPANAAARFGIVDGKLKAKGRPAKEALLGSSILGATIALTEAISVQLGDVVARSHKDSGLSVDDWNALPETEREARLAKTVEVMVAEASAPSTTKPESKPTQKPEVVPTPKPKAAKAKAPAKKASAKTA